MEKYRDIANFYLVYISEAHAADVWPIGLSAGVINMKHRTIEERIQCAKNFQQRYSFKIPIITDTMENNFRNIFAAWPFRAFIIKNNKFKYISNIKNSEYDILDIYQYFENLNQFKTNPKNSYNNDF